MGHLGESMRQHGVPACSQCPRLPSAMYSRQNVTVQTAWLPGSQVPWNHKPSLHPLTHDTCNITESFQKPLKNQLFKLAANFVNAMLAIRLVFFWCKSGVATIKLQSTVVP